MPDLCRCSKSRSPHSYGLYEMHCLWIPMQDDPPAAGGYISLVSLSDLPGTWLRLWKVLIREFGFPQQTKALCYFIW